MGGARRTWSLVLTGVLIGAAFVVTAPMLARKILLDPTTAQEARDFIFASAAPEATREVELADPDPGALGPASVAALQKHFQRTGDLVLTSWTAPGRPVPGATAGWIEVRMTRTAEADPMSFTSTRGDPVTLCLRFESRWSATYEPRHSFHEVTCPPHARVTQ